MSSTYSAWHVLSPIESGEDHAVWSSAGGGISTADAAAAAARVTAQPCEVAQVATDTVSAAAAEAEAASSIETWQTPIDFDDAYLAFPVSTPSTIARSSPTGAAIVSAATHPMRSTVSGCPSGLASLPHLLGETTVMLRNVPSRYNPPTLLHDVVSAGFARTFDFFYLPIDFTSKKNKGYAFVNFLSPLGAVMFRDAFHGKQMVRFETKKVLQVVSAVTQGFEESASEYLRQQSARVQNPWFRPMVFSSEGDDENSPWRCRPLAEDSIPVAARTALRKSRRASLPSASQVGTVSRDSLSASGNDDDDDDDTGLAVALQEAVRGFIAECPRRPEDAETLVGAGRGGGRRRGARRGGACRRRGGGGEGPEVLPMSAHDCEPPEMPHVALLQPQGEAEHRLFQRRDMLAP